LHALPLLIAMDACRQLYGLGVRSNIPLGALASLPEADRVDVQIELCNQATSVADEPARDIYVSEERHEDGRPTVHAQRLASGGVRIAYSDGTVVAIDAAARCIRASTPEGQIPDDTAAYLLGPVMGAVLRMRGVVCLHASAVEVEGRAVAFVGPACAGKSTTAAALAGSGFPVITDDVLAIDEDDDGFSVRTGYARVRLWGDSVEGLFGRADALPRISPGWDKHYLDVSPPRSAFDTRRRPLACVFVLAPGPTASGRPEVHEASPTQPLLELVANSYSTHYQDRDGRGKELAFLASLCQRVPVRKLVVPRDFSALSALPSLVHAAIRARFPSQTAETFPAPLRRTAALRAG